MKTVALIGDECGNVLGRGEAGSSNFHNVGPSAAQKATITAVREAETQTKIVDQIPNVVVALAGLDSLRDNVMACRFVRDAKIASRSLVHDSVAYLMAVTQGKPGIIVNAGTGSVAAGINSEGNYIRVGDWGYIIDDEGSSYDIGRRALTASFRASDERAPSTKLASVLKHRLEVKTLEDVASKIYTDDQAVEKVASLAQLVAKMARHDRVARQILRDAGSVLAYMVYTVADRLRMTHEAFLVGKIGAFRSDYLCAQFNFRLRQYCPLARIARQRREPAMDILALAHIAMRYQDGNLRIGDQPFLRFLKIR